jgi:predicted PurR-regulated permease PerM
MSIGTDVEHAVVQTLLEVLILIGFVYLVLLVFSSTKRFKQTLTTLFGVGVILTIVSLPIVIWLEESRMAESQSAALGLILVVFLGWNIAVMSHVIHQAIEKQYVLSVVLTLGYIFLTFNLINFIYPIAA